MSPRGVSPEALAAVVAAMQAAGATEEMVAAVVGVCGESPKPHPGGRPRKHADGAARMRDLRRRRKDDGTSSVTPSVTSSSDGTGSVTPSGDGTSSVTPGRGRYELRDENNLRVRLIDACQGNVDAVADVVPILALIDQGCDLDLDVLPVVRAEVPELPRPLRNWGAQWLVREILAAREQRLAGHRVEAPPPAFAELQPAVLLAPHRSAPFSRLVRPRRTDPEVPPDQNADPRDDYPF
jgi:hypothetical protein